MTTGVIPAAHVDTQVGQERGPGGAAGLVLGRKILRRARAGPAVPRLCGLVVGKGVVGLVRIERLDKRDQDRVTHELVDDPDGLVEFGGVRRRGATRQA